LATANQLRPSDSLQGVEGLAVPQAAAAITAHVALYTVRRGETLVTIADRFGVSLSELRRWNGITGYKVEPGRRLHVAEPAMVSTRASRSRRRTAGGGAATKAHATGGPRASTQTAAPHGAKTPRGASSTKQAPARRRSTKRRTASKK
jgi:membrane-bound lytic murein transglycosylase D